MNCDVIRDLLPLYVDGLTSETSNKLIEEHLETCDGCRLCALHMGAPLESETDEIGREYVKAIERKERRTRIKIAVAALIPLLLLVGWWLNMEYRFQEEVGVTIEDTDRILKEMPGLVLSEEEIAAAGQIAQSQPLKNYMYDSTGDIIEIPSEEVPQFILDLIPESATRFQVTAEWGTSIMIEWFNANEYKRGYLYYTDEAHTGTITEIRKEIPKYKKQKSKTEPPDMKADYKAVYTVATKETKYEKTIYKHKWFSFLSEDRNPEY